MTEVWILYSARLERRNS